MDIISTIDLLIKNGGALATAIAFLWYLNKRDKENINIIKDLSKTQKKFGNMLNTHMKADVKVQKLIADNLQKLSNKVIK